MRRCLVTLFLFSTSSLISAQDAVLIINAKNSYSGIAVPGYTISFHQIEGLNNYSYKASGNEAIRMYNIPEGSYSITVESGGYESMSTMLKLDSTINTINFELIPIKSPPFLASSYIQPKRKAGYTFLTGYATDEYLLNPLAGVTVKNAKGDLLATSDIDGHYEFLLPWIGMENDLIISKPGYKDSIFHLTRLCEADDQIVNLSLENKNLAVADYINITSYPAQALGVEGNRVQTTNCITNINVGRGCSCHTCTTIDVVNIETYTKRVLIQEWLSCWGNQPGGLNSLEAGAVAVRSYAMQRVYVHIAAHGSYDICETTCCQVYNTTQSTNGNTAVDMTANYILEKNGSVAQAEYAAEQNNHATCGNCNTGDGSTFPCQPDAVCCGQTYNGHGRGMCQNGSARWATGLTVVSSSCTVGGANGFGAQTWQWILGHYYPTYALTTCQVITAVPDNNSLEEFNVFPNPNNGRFTIKMKFNSMKAVTFRLYNIYGQLVYQSDTYHFSGSQMKEIAAQSLEAGIYLLESTIGGKARTEKVVVAR